MIMKRGPCVCGVRCAWLTPVVRSANGNGGERAPPLALRTTDPHRIGSDPHVLFEVDALLLPMRNSCKGHGQHGNIHSNHT